MKNEKIKLSHDYNEICIFSITLSWSTDPEPNTSNKILGENCTGLLHCIQLNLFDSHI